MSTENTLTIFLPPQGAIADKVLEILGGWATAELIGESYWVPLAPPQSLEVEAKRVNRDGIQMVMLPDAIGQTSWDTVRYVVLQPVSPGDEPDFEQIEFAVAWKEHLQVTVLPHTTKLITVNLIIPTFGIEELTQRCLIHTWDLTVVASPEERESPKHPNIFRNRALAEHSAMAAASVGGLWVGATNAPVEQYIGESNSGDAKPRLVRAYVRTVLGGDPGQEIATRALAPANGMWCLPEDFDGLAICPDPDSMINRVVVELGLLDGGALVYSPPPNDVVPVKGRVGIKAIWREFVEFFQWLVMRIKRIPGQIVESVERRITEKVWGAHGSYAFGFGVTPEREQVVSLVELRPKSTPRGGKDLRNFAMSVLSHMGSNLAMDPPRPALWRDLRTLAFSLVDGGKFPTSFEKLETTPRQLLLDPGLISPNPSSDSFSIPDSIATTNTELLGWTGVEIRPFDPFGALLLRADLARVESQSSSTVAMSASPQTVSTALETVPDDLDDPSVAPGATEETSEKTVGSEESSSEMRAAVTPPQPASEPASSANPIADLLRSFDRWRDQHRSALTWRVAERVGSEANSASSDLVEALSNLDPDIHVDISEIERARRRFLRMALIWFLLGLATGLIGTFVFNNRYTAILGLVLFLMLTLNSFFRYTRKKSEVEFAFECLVAVQRNAMARMEHSAKELTRISSLYELTVDWCELIGHHVHAPWLSVESDHLDGEELRTVAVRPPSLIIGVSDPDELKVTTLSNVERRAMQGVAWLGSEFEATKMRLLRRRGAELGRTTDSIEADDDCWANPNGSRAFLLEQIRSGDPQREAYRIALEGIRDRCARRNPSEIFTNVSFGNEGERSEPIDEFLTALEPDDYLQVPGFIADLLTPPARVARRHEDPKSHVVLPPGLVGDASASEKPAHITRDGRYLVQSVRVDVGHNLSPSDYEMFDTGSLQQAESGPTGDDDPW